MEYILYFDNYILDFIQTTLKCDFLDFIMPYITLLGDNGILWIILGVVLTFVKKTKPLGISILLSLLIGFVLCNLTIKPLVARIRPYEANGFENLLVSPLSDFSFPSGHTLASFEMAVCVYLFNRKWGIAAIVVASLVAFSRLYLYVHYPTDVLFGIVLGIIIACFSVFIVKKTITKTNSRKI